MPLTPFVAHRNPPVRSASALGAPADLRSWLGEDRLLQAAIEYAAARALALPGPRNFHHGGQSYPVAQLLALLAFAYLSARFGSAEIEEELETDAALRYLCAGRFPSSPALRQFRRVHRDTLGSVLQDVISLAIHERAAVRWPLFAGQFCPAQPGANLCLEPASERARREAASRLARAILADTMALDV